jgi:hypothetical protein
VSEKIVIDVLTLDSVQCAACGYMTEAVAALPQEIQDAIVYKEWSIKNKEGVAKFLEMKGRVLPTIAIQGDLLFESIIPQYEELIDALAERAPTPELAERIKALRELGFDFDNLEANLAKMEAGKNTRRVEA